MGGAASFMISKTKGFQMQTVKLNSYKLQTYAGELKFAELVSATQKQGISNIANNNGVLQVTMDALPGDFANGESITIDNLAASTPTQTVVAQYLDGKEFIVENLNGTTFDLGGSSFPAFTPFAAHSPAP